ncbi:MAG: hypothetical protein FIB07_01895 [Candidatus Methanoperedens sp.]|nr:hypothetical protein [Candidatus Methanoperedens sp.]
MGTYGIDTGEYTATDIFAPLFVVFLFFVLLLAYYLYLRFFERRSRMLIDNSEQEIGDEIDYRFHGNVLSYTLKIKKVNDSEWKAYKLFRSGRKVSLRKGNLRKIIDYMNRNFGYDDEVTDVTSNIYQTC